MKKIILLFLASLGIRSATTLTGTVKGPDGVGITGAIYLSVSQQAALLSTGGCTGPVEVVPTYQVKVTLTSGSIIGSPTVYGNDCMLPLNLYYNVRVVDSNGNVLFTDRS